MGRTTLVVGCLHHTQHYMFHPLGEEGVGETRFSPSYEINYERINYHGDDHPDYA